jgi:hypothetical protein
MSIMVDLLPGWESRPCAGTDLVLWFGPPEPDEPGGYLEPRDQRLWREARACAICASCPFLSPCLEAEMRGPAEHMWGVRAGLTAFQRRSLLRRRRRSAAAA